MSKNLTFSLVTPRYRSREQKLLFVFLICFLFHQWMIRLCSSVLQGDCFPEKRVSDRNLATFLVAHSRP